MSQRLSASSVAKTLAPTCIGAVLGLGVGALILKNNADLIPSQKQEAALFLSYANKISSNLPLGLLPYNPEIQNVLRNQCSAIVQPQDRIVLSDQGVVLDGSSIPFSSASACLRNYASSLVRPLDRRRILFSFPAIFGFLGFMTKISLKQASRTSRPRKTPQNAPTA